jgi:hypothetical protein
VLVENCDYGTLKDQMIRDRIVVGIRNTALSERMQSEAALTLEKAKTMARQKEAIAEQNSQLRGDGSKQSPIVLGQVKPQAKRRDTVRSDKPPQGKGAVVVLQGNPYVHVVADQSTRKETGALQRKPHATNAIEKVISRASVFLRLWQPPPVN